MNVWVRGGRGPVKGVALGEGYAMGLHAWSVLSNITHLNVTVVTMMFNQVLLRNIKKLNKKMRRKNP